MVWQGRLRVRLIACMHGESRLIGLRGDLPWRLAPDLAHFRKKIAGGATVIGRKTVEEALRTHPQGLPCHSVCVLSRSGWSRPARISSDVSGGDSSRFLSAPCLLKALQMLEGRPAPPSGTVWILGGAGVFREALPLAESLSLTRIVEGFDPQLAGANEPSTEPVYFPEEWQDFFELASSSDVGALVNSNDQDTGDSGNPLHETLFDAESGLTYRFEEFIARRKSNVLS
eukprot:TRINITY_DN9491_c0_g1_i1.p1 TRINITY_DN9491_c0_g1~~TRINITY_DN9491_c0_g1_i1.p1  ORF type:complete len:229 (+),score=33.26 TRINITY_DN9491_c0_g1_i1:300-986(+)